MLWTQRLWRLGPHFPAYGAGAVLNADHPSTAPRPWQACHDTCSGQSLTRYFFSQFINRNFSQVLFIHGHTWEYLTTNTCEHPFLPETSLWHCVLLDLLCLSGYSTASFTGSCSVFSTPLSFLFVLFNYHLGWSNAYLQLSNRVNFKHLVTWYIKLK